MTVQRGDAASGFSTAAYFGHCTVEYSRSYRFVYSLVNSYFSLEGIQF